MRRPLPLLLAALLVAPCPALFGQSAPAGRISVDHGLGSHLLTDVYQDGRGFLWIATMYGLDRFDGKRVVHIPPPKEIRKHGRPVYQIVPFDDERLLLGTDRGLELFQVADHSFAAVPLAANGEDEEVQLLRKDATGHYWACTPRNVHRLDPGLKVLESHLTQPNPRSSRNRNVWRLTCLPDGSSLFLLHNGLHQWMPGSGTISAVQGNAPLPYGFLAENPTSHSGLLAERYLFRLAEGSVDLHDVRTGRTQRFSLPATSGHQLCGSWGNRFATLHEKHGVTVHEVSADRAGPMLHQRASRLAPGLSISRVFEDDEQNLWALSLHHGMVLLDGGHIRFRNTALSTSRPGAPGAYIGRIIPMDTAVLVATFGEGYELFGPDGNFIAQQSVGPGPGAGNMVWTVQKVNGSHWIGTQEGVKCIDPDGRPVRLPMPHLAVLDSVPITLLFEDSRRTVWAGLGRGRGLAAYNARTGQFRHFPFRTGAYPFLYPRQAGEDQRGDIWFTNEATSDLVLWNRSDGTFNIVSIPGLNSVVQYNSGAFHLDRVGDELWYGSFPVGLVRMHMGTRKATVYGPADGLDATVLGITMDNRKRLWLCTSRGITCFDPESGKVLDYTRSDGLMATFHSAKPYYDAERNRVYAGGEGWLTWFEVPGELRDPRPLRIVLTDVSVNDSLFRVEQGGMLKLGPRQNNLLVQFAGINLVDGANNRYQYRLNGGNWTDLGHAAEVRFASLRHGRYALEARAARNHGEWGEAVPLLHFNITPKFTSTPWFHLSWAAALSLIIMAWYRYRLYQMRKLAAMRSAISQDLHDEIGSRLTNINLMGQLVRRSPDQAEQQQLMQRIQEESQTISQSMREIIWSVDPRHDDLELAMPRMLSFASQLLEAAGVEVQARIGELADVHLDMAQRRDMFLIFKEAVHNAAKHSGASQVSIRAEKERQHFTLEVKDDGNGTDLQRVNGSLGGLRYMRERATRHGWQLLLDTRPGGGTSVRLRMNL